MALAQRPDHTAMNFPLTGPFRRLKSQIKGMAFHADNCIYDRYAEQKNCNFRDN